MAGETGTGLGDKPLLGKYLPSLCLWSSRSLARSLRASPQKCQHVLSTRNEKVAVTRARLSPSTAGNPSPFGDRGMSVQTRTR